MSLVPLFRAHFEQIRSQDAAEWQASYMRYLFPFLGVRGPTLRKVVLAVKKAHPSVCWRDEVKTLWAEPEREFHYAAIFWAIAHKNRAISEDLFFYEELISSNSWWDSVDTIAPHLVGALVQKHPELVSQVEKWLHSPHLWLRRSALLYQLHWKAKTDTERLFRYCTILSHEKEFFIRKAIGWVLREYSKTHPQAVAQYVKTAPLSPLSLREAKKYIK